VEFGVLGPLTVWRGGVSLELGTPKARTLLAVLLCRAGRPVTGDALAEAIWGEEQPKSAAKNVQTYVHRLRQSLAEPSRIAWAGSGYLLRAGRDELDAARFEDLATMARAALVTEELEQSRRLFVEALGLWRGPAFAGLAEVSALAAEAARLDELRLGVLEERIDVDLRLRRHGELLGELTALTKEHPLRERMWAQLMLALYRCGRRADALGAYLQVRDLLVEETGLDPGHKLRDLHQAILSEDPTLDPVVDTGAREHRGVGVTTSARPMMLPPALGDFTGQRAELARMEAVLRTERARDEAAAVVTISGPGGTGKSALAVQAAHRLRSGYADGQLFSALAGSRAEPADAAIVLGRFLRALGVPPTAVPDAADERAELYRSLLAERRILVVLDDALDEAQLAPLLPASGTCGVIVTSRVRLGGLGGAHRVELGEMSEADGVALLRNSTGRLASATDAELAAVVRLCARLPLALRIVGSLLTSRPHWRLPDLTSRLSDEQDRLDALRYRDLEVRASFELSYAGLRPEARRLFRLSGLLEAPHFPLWAAAAVLDTDLGAAQELLDELVDVHLVNVTGTANGQTRYGFHDLTRAYARERAKVEETEADRHAAVARALGALLALTDLADRDHMGQNMFQRHAPRWRAEQVEASLPPGVPPMSVLDAERTALVAGVRQAAALGRDALCWELAVGGHALFEAERYFDEWQTCYDTAMALAETAGNLRGQARLLISMAGLRYTRRRYGAGEESNTAAMHLFERIGDQRGYLEALSNAPFFLVPSGRLTETIAVGREAYEQLTACGQAAAALHAYSQVGLAHLQAGRPAVAVEVFAEIVAEARERGIRTLIARDTYWLGQAQLALGRHAEAERAFTELAAYASDIGSSGEFYMAHARGCLHLARGEYRDARLRLTEAMEIARALDDPMFETRVVVDLLDTELHDHQDLPAMIKLGEHAAETARSIDYTYLLAGVLDRLARLHTAAGDDDAAGHLAREAATARARIR
jgi:DNA-binding SARP family transcriptional activator